ncbi:MAG: MarR family transcriptional regulator [Azospirillaceae bacterium]
MTTVRDQPKAGSARARRKRQPVELDQAFLPGQLGYMLRRAQIAAFQDYARHAGGFGITPGQFGVLVLIAANEGLSQTELGEALGIDRSTMVAVIDRLEARGIVVRAPSPRDRRSYALRLSEAGRALVAEMRPAIQAHQDSLAGRLGPGEADTLLRLLAKLAPTPG